MSHRPFVFAAKNHRTFPKTKGTVLFERRHETDDSLLIEKGRAPSNRFFDIRAAGVHDFSQMFQDRPGKRRGAFNVTINARIFFRHAAYSSSRGCCEEVAAV